MAATSPEKPQNEASEVAKPPQKVDELFQKCDAFLNGIPVIEAIAKQSQVSPVWLVAESLLFVLVTVMVLAHVASHFAVALTGTLFPLVKSLQAVHSEKHMDQWLVYWCIYNLLALVDYGSAIYVKIFPHYFILKYFVLIALMLPQLNLSQTIYTKGIKPHLDKLLKKEEPPVAPAAEAAPEPANKPLPKKPPPKKKVFMAIKAASWIK